MGSCRIYALLGAPQGEPTAALMGTPWGAHDVKIYVADVAQFTQTASAKLPPSFREASAARAVAKS